MLQAEESFFFDQSMKDQTHDLGLFDVSTKKAPN